MRHARSLAVTGDAFLQPHCKIDSLLNWLRKTQAIAKAHLANGLSLVVVIYSYTHVYRKALAPCGYMLIGNGLFFLRSKIDAPPRSKSNKLGGLGLAS